MNMKYINTYLATPGQRLLNVLAQRYFIILVRLLLLLLRLLMLLLVVIIMVREVDGLFVVNVVCHYIVECIYF